MITFLKGHLVEKKPSFIVLEVGNIGYYIKISLYTYLDILKKEEKKQENEKECFIYTHPIIREDQHSIYGFSSVEERELFLLLISVNGLGPNIAITMLSSCVNLEELTLSIARGEEESLKKFKGVGTKTAKRIILELKEKSYFKNHSFSSKEPLDGSMSLLRKDALDALIKLGCTKDERTLRLLDETIKKNPLLSIGEIIREVLRMV